MMACSFARMLDMPTPFDSLVRFLQRYRRLFVLSGAGCSTASGIPDYRDANGAWKRTPPITIQTFTSGLPAQQRYWARSLVGWRHFGRAQPNAAHYALARLEAQGCIKGLVTQNVDGLHQSAGSQNVIDLHGRLDQVACLKCTYRQARSGFQRLLEVHNPHWLHMQAADAPDGDADLEAKSFASFHVPSCPDCGGTLKPDVVFFGENVPRDRVALAMGMLNDADAMLVVGSSLTVFSGFRFARAAAERGLPIAAINLGRTRADNLLHLKVNQPCADVLSALTDAHTARSIETQG